MTKQFRLLGPLQVENGGGSVRLNGPKRRGLLAYLLVHRGSPSPIERIVDALWEGSPSPSAEATVRTYVSQLRGLFGDDGPALALRHGGYVLDVEPDCIDAVRFEAAVGEALAETSADCRLAHLEEALELWRGPPLDEFAGAPWADEAIRHWTRLRMLALERKVDALLETGRATEALMTVETAVSEHPLHEPLWIALMLARYRCGRQADALRAAREARQLLASELGIDPGPELVELEQRILTQDPALLQPRGEASVVVQQSPLPAGVVTFLLTDIEGSTEAWDLQPEAMAQVLPRHEAIIDRVVGEHNGRLLKTRGEGDATLSVFGKASDAAAAAVALQLALTAEEWPAALPMRTRAALHTGEAQLRGGDYFGATLNRAARLRALAHGGEVLCSGATHDMVVDALPDDFTVIDLGTHALRGLQRGERVFAIGHPDLPTVEPRVRDMAPAVAPALLGRDPELRLIRTALAEVRSGNGRLVLISGEPGIGKSRLVQEVERLARGEGMQTLWGRCFETDAAPAYLPWIEVVRHALGLQLGGLLPHVGEHTAELARLVPELAAAPARDGVVDDEAEAQWRLFESFVALLTAVASSRPAMIVLEDMHWADRSSLKLLEHVVARLASCDLLVVATFRYAPADGSDSLEAALGRLARFQPVWLTLTGLDDAAIGEVVEAVAPGSPQHAEIVARSGGNPFFAKELAQLGDDGGIPATVRAGVASRVRSLGAVSADVLRGAAILGGDIDADLVAALVESDPAQVASVVDEAARIGLVDDSSFAPRFAHAILREALVDTIGPHRMRAMHERAARILSHLPERLDEAAQHWIDALRPETAADALDTTVRAAERAYSMLAFDEAASHYANALTILERLHDPASLRRVDLLQAYGDAAARAGDLAAARDALRSAIDIAVLTGDVTRAARAAISFHGPRTGRPFRKSRRDEERALLSDVIAMADECELAVRSQLHARLARSISQGNQHAVLARELAQQSGDPRATAHAWFATFSCCSAGDVELLQQAATESWRAAKCAHDGELEAEAVMLQYIVASQLGDRGAADEARARHALLARRLGQPFYRAADIALSARESLAAGDLRRAEEDDTSLEHFSDGRMTLGYLVRLFQIRRWQGRTGEAPWEDAARVVDQLEGYGGDTLLVLNGLHHADSGDPDPAHACLDQAWSRDFARAAEEDSWETSYLFAFLADLCAALAERSRARAMLDAIAGWNGQHAQVEYALYLGPFALYVGMLERVVGELDSAAANLTRAVAQAGQMRSSPYAARAQVELARVMSLTGRCDEAEQLLAQARTTAAQPGLTFIERCADALSS